MTALPPWCVEAATRAETDPALGDLLGAAAALWPDREAVDDGSTGFSFAELEQGATAVATWLHDHDVGRGDRVAVLATKSALMPLVALGIWKRGAVYVPCDAENPDARLTTLLGRLRSRVVISLDDRPPLVPSATWVGRRQLEAIVAGELLRPAPPTVVHGDDDPAYIIFTSGSTGEPKGVEISAGSLVAYFHAHNQLMRFTSASRGLSLAPFHFDVSIEDTLLPLSVGAYVYQFCHLPAGPILRAVLGRQRISHLIAVATLLTVITGDGRGIDRATFPCLEMVMTGGEVCDPGILNTWKEALPGARVFNLYGPTEVTIICFGYEIRRPDRQRRTPYPIGRPLRDVQAMIVHDGVEVTEADVPGELWIGGRQVMRRYFDQPEETARRVMEVGGVRFYRTGDICRYDAAGDVLYEGRLDDEVKVAGRRIHLGEIQQVALGHDGVDSAVVALVRRGRIDVIALVLMAGDRRVVGEVERDLRDRLPGYMCPTVIAWSATLAVGRTGKVDASTLVERLRVATETSLAIRFVLDVDGVFVPDEKSVDA